jgi:hypothetical protein
MTLAMHVRPLQVSLPHLNGWEAMVSRAAQLRSFVMARLVSARREVTAP